MYLGMAHSPASLRPWSSLTTGVPAALRSPPDSDVVAQQLANLQGCERGLLAPSTLHLFWDLFGMLGRDDAAIYMDAGVYPIARWGVERAAGRGVPVRTFPHYDTASLARCLRQDRRSNALPLVVACGFCPGCGRHVPIRSYVEVLRPFGGHLVLDDSQALGIFGHSPGVDAPYGRGGGGSLCWSGAQSPDVLMVSSLAKGFGVPVAILSGSRAAIDRFEAESETRVHCSPPSLAVIHAAEHALAVNKTVGDVLRLRLARLVRHLRKCLREKDLNTAGGLFPVQTLRLDPRVDVLRFHQELLTRGINTVLNQASDDQNAELSLIVTLHHRPDDIKCSVQALAEARAVTGARFQTIATLGSQATSDVREWESCQKRDNHA